MGYQLTDAFWVGRLGAAAVAAVAISFPVTFLVIAAGSGLAIAGATLSASTWVPDARTWSTTSPRRRW
ncbi:MAG: MATE family efflux transporter [Verrucomicrobiota bacterium]